MAAKDNAAWRSFQEEMKRKRMKGTAKDRKRTKKSELVVQRLSAEVSGKAQKFSRVGAREFVPYNPDEELTLEGIKSACEKHFARSLSRSQKCDVLAGEQGPSCKTLEQVPNITKLIHVRFISVESDEKYENETYDLAGGSSDDDLRDTRSWLKTNEQSKKQATRSFERAPTPKAPEPLRSKCYPKSLSVLDMLKLGKVVDKESTTVINLYSFNIELLAWNKIPTVVEFVVDENVLGSGGFREAFKATTKHPLYANTRWVIKKYLSGAKEQISQMMQSFESHTKKAVQMHMLARNFAFQLEKNVLASTDGKLWSGEHLCYNKVFLGITDKKECVTVEEYVEGTFTKYINNDGLLCVEKSNEFGMKAECLAHFSYEKSDKKLMVLDIQGSGSTLYDPEIATSELFDKDKEMLFCSGNLTKIAIDTFVTEHECNNYCFSAGLAKLH